MEKDLEILVTKCLRSLRLAYQNALDWIIYKQQSLVARSSGAWKIQDQAPVDSLSQAGSLCLVDGTSWLHPQLEKGAPSSLRLFKIRPRIPFMRTDPHDLVLS